MTNSKKLLLVDGNSVMFRAFFALHNQLERFTNSKGLHTNAVYAFKNMLDIILKKVQPTHALVAFDAGKTTFRTKKFTDYKGGRSKTPSELSEQVPYIQKLIKSYGLQVYQLADFEADDIIGTLARQGAEAGFEVTVVTGDRDLTQLTTDSVSVAVTVKGVNDIELYTPAHVEEKLGLKPDQIVDMKGLMGDTSDNYPGVTKVGEKTAIRLLKTYGSMENLYAHVAELKTSKLKENLINDQAQAFMSQDLARIRTDAPLKIGIDDLTVEKPQSLELQQLYQELDFKSFLRQLDLPLADTPENNLDYTVLSEDNYQELFKLQGAIVFQLEMLTDNYHTASIVGFVVGQQNHWYVSDSVELLKKPDFKQWLAAETPTKSVFDAKRQFVAANRLGLSLGGVTFDLLLASYLLNPTNNSNDLGTIAHLHGFDQVREDENVYGKGAKLALPEKKTDFYQHLVQKAAAIETLQPQLMQELDVHQQADLFKTMELPLAKVLSEMEIAGITLDATTLEKMGTEFQRQLAIIEQRIYETAGETFNLNSPKQLGVVLFEKMGLPVIKRTKTGYSTSVDVLEQLKIASPIISDILDYRGLSKLQSTYVKGLLKTVAPDHKIHTRYLQTLTTTGRLSSVEPNMQNIPARDEGKKIRKAFVPSHPDWEILSSDYSQIELRVLAHISKDKNMQLAFQENRDIHANTAMKIFNLERADQVTPDMRRQAKATNFGIVYGISDYGLSQNIGITREQAKAFIQAYFEQYPQVYAYTQDIVKLAREQGYVETLFNRRRYLPDIHAKNFNLRGFAERTAMNTPIQGSAADIIKVAMIQVQKALKAHKLQARMLLQVHDELIFEAPSNEMAELKELIPSVMDSAVSLAVPLKVETGIGKTWFDAK